MLLQNWSTVPQRSLFSLEELNIQKLVALLQEADGQLGEQVRIAQYPPPTLSLHLDDYDMSLNLREPPFSVLQNREIPTCQIGTCVIYRSYR